MKHKYLFGILFSMVLLFLVIFRSLYGEAEEKAIDALNAQQLIHARQAKVGIEGFFRDVLDFLENTADLERIADLDDRGRALMDYGLRIHPGALKAVTRVDKSGRIVYTTPFHENVIGRDISGQEHMQRILENHETVVSDVFTAVQGYPAVAVHVPVLQEGAFRGTLGVLIDFQAISKRFLQKIHIGETGYAWMVSREGIELYCPVPGHTGNSVFDNCRDFPTILAMAENMLEGEEGITTYQYDRIREEQKETIKKHAVYLPIQVGDTFWSIVVATSEDEVLASLETFKNQLIALFCALLLAGVLFAYYGMRAWGIVREEAERRKAEAALRESEERYRSLFEGVPLGLYRTDPEGRIVEANPALVEMLGFTDRDALLQVNAARFFVHPEDQKEQRRILSREGLLRGHEVELRRRDGSTLWVRDSAQAALDEEGRVYYEGSLEDVTERKQAELELQRLAEAVRQAKEGIAVTDPDGAITYANPAFGQITGYGPDEIIGKNPRFLKSGEHDEEHYRELWETILGRNRWAGHMVNRRKDGTLYTADCSISPVQDDEGRIMGFVWVTRDITQDIELEKRMAQAQKMEAIGTLAGGIAHDFNNILGAILGNAELAMMDVPDDSPAQESLREVRQSSLRARDLVRQILVIARQQEERLETIHVEPIVKECLKMLRATIPSFVEIRQRIEPDLPTVLADPTQVHQIIMNLCTNASQVMEGEGGTLEVSLEPDEVESERMTATGGLAPGRYLRLRVSDTGPGIAREALDKIFEPYFTTKGVGEGTGLGLAVVHGIVKERGGGIQVESRQGQGAAFTVYLPASDTSSPESGFREKEEELPFGSERILFVDDEPPILRLGRRMLERQGYRVETLASGSEALARFQADPDGFDLVITDMTMPHMRGDELARHLLALRPGLPVILCTGYSKQISDEKAEEVGIRALVMKPLSTHDLLNTVHRVLQEADA